MASNLTFVEELPMLNVSEDLINAADTCKRQFRVMFDGTDVQLADVLYANGTPLRGVAYNGVLYPVKRDAKRDEEDERVWILDVDFVNPKPQDKKDNTANATKYNVKISMTTVPYEETVHRDNANITIYNCIGEPPDPPLTRVYYDSQWNMSYHVVAPDWATLNACKGAANLGNVTLTINGANKTFSNYTLKLDGYTFDADVDSNGTAVCQVNLNFLERADGWATKFANKSLHKLVNFLGTPVREPILWDDCPNPPASTSILSRHEVDQPQYLNANGTAVVAANGTITLSSANIVPCVDFTSLLAEIHT